MTNEPQEAEHEQRQEDQTKRRLCDYCNDREAVLYCRADSAKLCLFCDKEVHSTNQLFSKHSRLQLCDVCDASPASIFCETEQSVLCTNCDWERHNQSNLHVSSVHNRRPIESFTGLPSANELFSIIGFDDVDSKSLISSDETRNYSHFDGVDGNECSDMFSWEALDFASIDDLIVSSDAGHNFQAMGVPPLPKNRNAACGQHKEEMLHQLRQLAKLEPNFKYENANIEPLIGFQSLVPEPNLHPGNRHSGPKREAEPILCPAHEASALQWFNGIFEPENELLSPLFKSHNEESFVVPNKHLDTGGCVGKASEVGGQGLSQHATNTETSKIIPRIGVHELNSQERDSALSRYKEKKKTRRYDKHIRYESRKVRAESRMRIKGRFAKIDH